MDNFKQAKIPGFKDLAVLLTAYFCLRVLFVSIPVLKTWLFIQPAGGLVALFWGAGLFDGTAWIYEAGHFQVVLNASCSGTTFFSILAAYTLMKYLSGDISAWWLFASYPIALSANASRVLSSIYVYGYSPAWFSPNTHEALHIVVGVVIFALTLIALSLVWEFPARS